MRSNPEITVRCPENVGSILRYTYGEALRGNSGKKSYHPTKLEESTPGFYPL
jgi:hypothetical protein